MEGIEFRAVRDAGTYKPQVLLSRILYSGGEQKTFMHDYELENVQCHVSPIRKFFEDSST